MATPAVKKPPKIPLNEMLRKPSVQALVGDYLQNYVDENYVPLLDSEGNFTGSHYDRNVGPPPDVPDQPSAARYEFHAQYLDKKYGGKFQPQVGQPIPEFNPVDPYQSSGIFNSVENMARAAYPETLTGAAEKGLKSFVGVQNPQSNFFGMIDQNKAEAFQPNTAERAITPLIEFAEDLPAMVGVSLATEGAGLPAVATRVGGLAAKTAKVLGGSEAALATATRLGVAATTSAGNFGSYEFAKSFFQGKGFPESLKAGAKGAALGAALPLAGAAGEGIAGGIAQPALRKLAEYTLPATSEVAVFGGLGPLLDGRAPTPQDFLSAAGFIVGMKTAGKIASVGARGWNRAVSDRAAKLEEMAKGATDPAAIVTDQMELATKASGNVSVPFIDKAVEAAKNKGETYIGTVKDFATNDVLRADFKPIMDYGVVVTDKMPVDPNAPTAVHPGTIGYRGSRPVIILNKDYPGFFGFTTLHEMTHWMQMGKGREITGEKPEVRAEAAAKYATKPNLTASEKSIRAKEVAAQRGWGRTVQNAGDKEFTLEELQKNGQTTQPIKTITKGNEPQAVRFVTLETGQESKNPVSKGLYGPKREGATIGVYGHGDKKVSNILDLSASTPETAVKLVRAAKAQADSREQNLYLSSRGVPAEQIKGLTDAGLIGKAVKGRFKVKAEPESPKVKALPFRTLSGVTAPKAEASFDEAMKDVDPGHIAKVKNRIAAGIEPLRRVENRVHTPEGKQGVDMLSNYSYLKAAITQGHLDNLDKLGIWKLTPEQASSPEAAAKMQPFFESVVPMIKKWKPDFKPLKDYLTRIIKRPVLEQWADDIRALAKSLRESNLNAEDIAKMGDDVRLKAALAKMSEGARKNVQFLMSSGQVKNLGAAIDAFQGDVKRQWFGEPGFLKHRSLKYLPDVYETDVRLIGKHYADRLGRWQAAQEAFGPDLAHFNKVVGDLYDKGSPEANHIALAMEHLSGEYDFQHGLTGTAKTAMDMFSSGQTAFKIGLGFATFKNVFQTIESTFADLGFGNTILGLRDLRNPEIKGMIRRSGVGEYMDERVLEAQLGYLPGNAWRKFAEFTTKWSGFTGINRFNANLAAATINRALPKWYELAKESGRRGDLARIKLSEVGVDWKKPLDDAQIGRAMYEFARDSQLQRNVLKEPFFMNETLFRPFLLFKRFGIKQAMYITHMLKRDLQHGNFGSLIRLTVGGALGGAASVWGINKAKSIISGQPVYDRNDTMLDAILNNIGSIGAMGMLGDLMSVDRLSQMPSRAKFLLTPVMFSDINTVSDAWTKVLADHERYGDWWLTARRNADNIVSPLGSFPRLVAKRLEGDSQIKDSLKAQKTQEKEEIFNLILSGNGTAAANRIAKWNEAYKGKGPDFAIKLSDVSSSQLVKYVERKAKTYAEQFGTKGTQAYVKAQKERRLQLMEHIQQGR